MNILFKYSALFILLFSLPLCSMDLTSSCKKRSMVAEYIKENSNLLCFMVGSTLIGYSIIKLMSVEEWETKKLIVPTLGLAGGVGVACSMQLFPSFFNKVQSKQERHYLKMHRSLMRIADQLNNFYPYNTQHWHGIYNTHAQIDIDQWEKVLLCFEKMPYQDPLTKIAERKENRSYFNRLPWELESIIHTTHKYYFKTLHLDALNKFFYDDIKFFENGKLVKERKAWEILMPVLLFKPSAKKDTLANALEKVFGKKYTIKYRNKIGYLEQIKNHVQNPTENKFPSFSFNEKEKIIVSSNHPRGLYNIDKWLEKWKNRSSSLYTSNDAAEEAIERTKNKYEDRLGAIEKLKYEKAELERCDNCSIIRCYIFNCLKKVEALTPEVLEDLKNDKKLNNYRKALQRYKIL